MASVIFHTFKAGRERNASGLGGIQQISPRSVLGVKNSLEALKLYIDLLKNGADGNL